MPQTITVAENQTFTIQANPLDANGFPGVVPAGASYSWASDNAAVATVAVSTGPASQVNSISPGTADITLTETPASGPPVVSSFQVIVLGGPVASFSFTFGTPS